MIDWYVISNPDLYLREKGGEAEFMPVAKAVAELIDRGLASDEQSATDLMYQALSNEKQIELPKTSEKSAGFLYARKTTGRHQKHLVLLRRMAYEHMGTNHHSQGLGVGDDDDTVLTDCIEQNLCFVKHILDHVAGSCEKLRLVPGALDVPYIKKLLEKAEKVSEVRHGLDPWKSGKERAR